MVLPFVGVSSGDRVSASSVLTRVGYPNVNAGGLLLAIWEEGHVISVARALLGVMVVTRRAGATAPEA
jgi:hypothetical protein